MRKKTPLLATAQLFIILIIEGLAGRTGEFARH